MAVQYREHHASSNQLRRIAGETDMLDAATERELLREAVNGSKKAADHLLRAHFRLVLAVARRHEKFGVAMDDLISEGMLALAEALRRFDMSREVRFATYADGWVRAFIRRATLENRRMVPLPSTRAARRLLAHRYRTEEHLSHVLGRNVTREEIAEALSVGVRDVEMMDAALTGRDVALVSPGDKAGVDLIDEHASPEENVGNVDESKHQAALIEFALSRLPEREREIITRRFCADDPEALSVIGDSLGVSRERVRQLESRAKMKLRLELATLAA